MDEQYLATCTTEELESHVKSEPASSEDEDDSSENDRENRAEDEKPTSTVACQTPVDGDEHHSKEVAINDLQQFSGSLEEADATGVKSGKIFRCRYCRYRVKHLHTLHKHEAAHRERRFHNCKSCSFSHPSEIKLKEHEWEHTGVKPFECEKCSYKSRYYVDLLKHKRVHSSYKKYSCHLCSFRCKWRGNLSKHLGTHSESRPYNCSLCDKWFKTKSILDSHMRVHSTILPFSCDDCGFKAKTKFEIKNHKLSHSDVRNFPCTFPGCTQRCKTNSDLRKHSVVHVTTFDCICHICNKGFKDMSRLKKHIQGHEEKGKEHLCPFCGKILYSKNGFRHHLYKHKSNKTFICNVCGHRSTSTTNIKVHMRVHDLSRSSQCPICRCRFKELDHLLVHIGQNHSDTYAYLCDLCKKPFGKLGSLRFHIQRCHKSLSVAQDFDLIYNKDCCNHFEEDTNTGQGGYCEVRDELTESTLSNISSDKPMCVISAMGTSGESSGAVHNSGLKHDLADECQEIVFKSVNRDKDLSGPGSLEERKESAHSSCIQTNSCHKHQGADAGNTTFSNTDSNQNLKTTESKDIVEFNHFQCTDARASALNADLRTTESKDIVEPDHFQDTNATACALNSDLRTTESKDIVEPDHFQGTDAAAFALNSDLRTTESKDIVEPDHFQGTNAAAFALNLDGHTPAYDHCTKGLCLSVTDSNSLQIPIISDARKSTPVVHEDSELLKQHGLLDCQVEVRLERLPVDLNCTSSSSSSSSSSQLSSSNPWRVVSLDNLSVLNSQEKNSSARSVIEKNNDVASAAVREIMSTKVPSIVKLGTIGGVGVCLANKYSGLTFNYEKTGKKPRRWFMEPSMMPEKEAKKMRKYMRKKNIKNLLDSDNCDGRRNLRLEQNQEKHDNVLCEQITDPTMLKSQRKKNSPVAGEQKKKIILKPLSQQLKVSKTDVEMLENEGLEKMESERQSSRPQRSAAKQCLKMIEAINISETVIRMEEDNNFIVDPEVKDRPISQCKATVVENKHPFSHPSAKDANSQGNAFVKESKNLSPVAEYDKPELACEGMPQSHGNGKEPEHSRAGFGDEEDQETASDIVESADDQTGSGKQSGDGGGIYGARHKSKVAYRKGCSVSDLMSCDVSSEMSFKRKRSCKSSKFMMRNVKERQSYSSHMTEVSEKSRCHYEGSEGEIRKRGRGRPKKHLTGKGHKETFCLHGPSTSDLLTSPESCKQGMETMLQDNEHLTQHEDTEVCLERKGEVNSLGKQTAVTDNGDSQVCDLASSCQVKVPKRGRGRPRKSFVVECVDLIETGHQQAVTPQRSSASDSVFAPKNGKQKVGRPSKPQAQPQDCEEFMQSKGTHITCILDINGGESSPRRQSAANSQAELDGHITASTCQGGEIPKEGGVVPKQGGEVPKEGGEVPKQGGEVPKQEGEVPKQGEEVPKQGQEVPKQGKEDPKQCGVVPKQDGEVPKEGGEFPKQDKEVPKQDREVPKQDREVPKQDREVPKLDGEVPRQGGKVPKRGRGRPRKVLAMGCQGLMDRAHKGTLSINVPYASDSGSVSGSGKRIVKKCRKTQAMLHGGEDLVQNEDTDMTLGRKENLNTSDRLSVVNSKNVPYATCQDGNIPKPRRGRPRKILALDSNCKDPKQKAHKETLHLQESPVSDLVSASQSGTQEVEKILATDSVCKCTDLIDDGHRETCTLCLQGSSASNLVSASQGGKRKVGRPRKVKAMLHEINKDIAENEDKLISLDGTGNGNSSRRQSTVSDQRETAVSNQRECVLADQRESAVIDQGQSAVSDQGQSAYSDQGQSAYSDQGQSTYSDQGQSAYSDQGQSAYSDQGQSAYSDQGQSAYSDQGQSAYSDQGQSAYSDQGQSAYSDQGQSAYSDQGQSAYSDQGQSAYSDQGQSAYSDQGQSAYSDQGKSAYSDQGQSAISDQGQSAYSDQGQSAYSDQGQNAFSDQGQSAYSDQGQSAFSDQGQSTYSDQGQSTYSDQGQSTYSDQGQSTYSDQGQSPYSDQGQSTYSDQGQSTYSDQGQSAYSDQGRSVYNDQGQSVYNDQRPSAYAYSDQRQSAISVPRESAVIACNLASTDQAGVCSPLQSNCTNYNSVEERESESGKSNPTLSHTLDKGKFVYSGTFASQSDATKLHEENMNTFVHQPVSYNTNYADFMTNMSHVDPCSFVFKGEDRDIFQVSRQIRIGSPKSIQNQTQEMYEQENMFSLQVDDHACVQEILEDPMLYNPCESLPNYFALAFSSRIAGITSGLHDGLGYADSLSMSNNDYNVHGTTQEENQNDSNVHGTTQEENQNDSNVHDTTQEENQNDSNVHDTTQEENQNYSNVHDTTQEENQNDSNVHCTTQEENQNDSNVHDTTQEENQNDSNVHDTTQEENQNDCSVHDTTQEENQNDSNVHGTTQEENQNDSNVHDTTQEENQNDSNVHGTTQEENQNDSNVHVTTQEENQNDSNVHDTTQEENQNDSNVHDTTQEENQNYSNVHGRTQEENQNDSNVHGTTQKENQNDSSVHSTTQEEDQRTLHSSNTALDNKHYVLQTLTECTEESKTNREEGIVSKHLIQASGLWLSRHSVSNCILAKAEDNGTDNTVQKPDSSLSASVGFPAPSALGGIVANHCNITTVSGVLNCNEASKTDQNITAFLDPSELKSYGLFRVDEIKSLVEAHVDHKCRVTEKITCARDSESFSSIAHTGTDKCTAELSTALDIEDAELGQEDIRFLDQDQNAMQDNFGTLTDIGEEGCNVSHSEIHDGKTGLCHEQCRASRISSMSAQKSVGIKNPEKDGDAFANADANFILDLGNGDQALSNGQTDARSSPVSLNDYFTLQNAMHNIVNVSDSLPVSEKVSECFKDQESCQARSEVQSMDALPSCASTCAGMSCLVSQVIITTAECSPPPSLSSSSSLTSSSTSESDPPGQSITLPWHSHDSHMALPLQSHDSQTPLPLQSHDSQTPLPLQSHDSQTPLPLQSHDSQTPLPLQSLDSQTPLPLHSHDSQTPSPLQSHDSQTPLPPQSHDAQTALPPQSHDSQTPLPLPSHDSQTLLPLQSHDSQTPLPPQSHDAQTPLPPQSHDSQTPLPPQSHDSQTPLPLQSHDSQTPLQSQSHDSQTPLPPQSHDARTPLPPQSHDSQTALPPVVKNTQEPVMENIQEPVVKNTQEPVMENIQEPVVKSTQEQVLENTEEPAVKNTHKPGMKNMYEPGMENIQEPEMENIQEPGMKNTQEPGMKNTQEPGMKNSQEPGMENTQEPGMENTQKPGMENTQKPGMENVQEPRIENTQEPGMENTQEPGMENTQEPGMENTQKPGMENIQEPVVKNTQEPEMENTQEPGMENIQEPVVKNTQEPGFENTQASSSFTEVEESVTNVELAKQSTMSKVSGQPPNNNRQSIAKNDHHKPCNFPSRPVTVISLEEFESQYSKKQKVSVKAVVEESTLPVSETIPRLREAGKGIGRTKIKRFRRSKKAIKRVLETMKKESRVKIHNECSRRSWRHISALKARQNDIEDEKKWENNLLFISEFCERQGSLKEVNPMHEKPTGQVTEPSFQESGESSLINHSLTYLNSTVNTVSGNLLETTCLMDSESQLMKSMSSCATEGIESDFQEIGGSSLINHSLTYLNSTVNTVAGHLSEATCLVDAESPHMKSMSRSETEVTEPSFQERGVASLINHSLTYLSNTVNTVSGNLSEATCVMDSESPHMKSMSSRETRAIASSFQESGGSSLINHSLTYLNSTTNTVSGNVLEATRLMDSESQHMKSMSSRETRAIASSFQESGGSSLINHSLTYLNSTTNTVSGNVLEATRLMDSESQHMKSMSSCETRAIESSFQESGELSPIDHRWTYLNSTTNTVSGNVLEATRLMDSESQHMKSMSSCETAGIEPSFQESGGSSLINHRLTYLNSPTNTVSGNVLEATRLMDSESQHMKSMSSCEILGIEPSFQESGGSSLINHSLTYLNSTVNTVSENLLQTTCLMESENQLMKSVSNCKTEGSNIIGKSCNVVKTPSMIVTDSPLPDVDKISTDSICKESRDHCDQDTDILENIPPAKLVQVLAECGYTVTNQNCVVRSNPQHGYGGSRSKVSHRANLPGSKLRMTDSSDKKAQTSLHYSQGIMDPLEMSMNGNTVAKGKMSVMQKEGKTDVSGNEESQTELFTFPENVTGGLSFSRAVNSSEDESLNQAMKSLKQTGYRVSSNGSIIKIRKNKDMNVLQSVGRHQPSDSENGTSVEAGNCLNFDKSLSDDSSIAFKRCKNSGEDDRQTGNSAQNSAYVLSELVVSQRKRKHLGNGNRKTHRLGGSSAANKKRKIYQTLGTQNRKRRESKTAVYSLIKLNTRLPGGYIITKSGQIRKRRRPAPQMSLSVLDRTVASTKTKEKVSDFLHLEATTTRIDCNEKSAINVKNQPCPTPDGHARNQDKHSKQKEQLQKWHQQQQLQQQQQQQQQQNLRQEESKVILDNQSPTSQTYSNHFEITEHLRNNMEGKVETDPLSDSVSNVTDFLPNGYIINASGCILKEHAQKLTGNNSAASNNDSRESTQDFVSGSMSIDASIFSNSLPKGYFVAENGCIVKSADHRCSKDLSFENDYACQEDEDADASNFEISGMMNIKFSNLAGEYLNKNTPTVNLMKRSRTSLETVLGNDGGTLSENYASHNNDNMCETNTLLPCALRASASSYRSQVTQSTLGASSTSSLHSQVTQSAMGTSAVSCHSQVTQSALGASTLSLNLPMTQSAVGASVSSHRSQSALGVSTSSLHSKVTQSALGVSTSSLHSKVTQSALGASTSSLHSKVTQSVLGASTSSLHSKVTQSVLGASTSSLHSKVTQSVLGASTSSLHSKVTQSVLGASTSSLHSKVTQSVLGASTSSLHSKVTQSVLGASTSSLHSKVTQSVLGASTSSLHSKVTQSVLGASTSSLHSKVTQSVLGASTSSLHSKVTQSVLGASTSSLYSQSALGASISSLHSQSALEASISSLHSQSALRASTSSLNSQSALGASISSLHSQSALGASTSSHNSQSALGAAISSRHSQSALGASTSSHHSQSAVGASISSLHSQSALVASISSLHSQSALGASTSSLHSQSALGASISSLHSQSALGASTSSHHSQSALGASISSLHSQSALGASISSLHSQSALGASISSLHSQSALGASTSSLYSQIALGASISSLYSQSALGASTSSLHSQSALGASISSLHSQSALGASISSLHSQSALGASISSLHSQSALGASISSLHSQSALGASISSLHSQSALGASTSSLHSQVTQSALGTSTIPLHSQNQMTQSSLCNDNLKLNKRLPDGKVTSLVENIAQGYRGSHDNCLKKRARPRSHDKDISESHSKRSRFIQDSTSLVETRDSQASILTSAVHFVASKAEWGKSCLPKENTFFVEAGTCTYLSNMESHPDLHRNICNARGEEGQLALHKSVCNTVYENGQHNLHRSVCNTGATATQGQPEYRKLCNADIVEKQIDSYRKFCHAGVKEEQPDMHSNTDIEGTLQRQAYHYMNSCNKSTVPSTSDEVHFQQNLQLSRADSTCQAFTMIIPDSVCEPLAPAAEAEMLAVNFHITEDATVDGKVIHLAESSKSDYRAASGSAEYLNTSLLLDSSLFDII